MSDSLTYPAPRRYTSRVLVAEDNPVHRSLVRSLLEQMGCEVDAVSDGQQALESYSSERYDLILMDWRMPRLDGVTATRKIRQAEDDANSGNRRIPIIALTAHALPGDRSRCLSAGMDDYLCKPVSRRNLDLMLSKWGSLSEETVEISTTSPREPSRASDLVLDMEQIEELAAIERDGAPGLVSHLIETYLADAPAKLTLLRTAAADDDALAVQIATHSFKSASSTVGAHRLYCMCNELELDARARRLDNLDVRVEEVLKEYDQVERELGFLRTRFSIESRKSEAGDEKTS